MATIDTFLAAASLAAASLAIWYLAYIHLFPERANPDSRP